MIESTKKVSEEPNYDKKVSDEMAWYHCGKCGSLFEGNFGQEESRVCGVCAKTPGTGVWPTGGNSGEDVKPAQPEFSKQPELVEEDGRRAVRKRRKGNLMMKIIVVWTFIMLLAVWLTNHYSGKTNQKEKLEKVVTGMTKGTLADENVALLNEALPECHRALGGFLSSGTPESRNQFVVNPIEIAGKMATFYSLNPLPKVSIKTLRRIGQDVIRVGDTWMVATRWKDKEGLEFDAVFRRNSGKWRLDWKHFSQYSEYPWTLFLAGEGPDEAEFRLLARQKLTNSDSERIGSRLVFTMFAPVFGKANETGMQSPDFVVDRRSDEGLLISAALADNANGKLPFGQSMPVLEGAGDIRLHVRVKRTELGGTRSFTLEKVIACHWIDSDVSSHDLDELKDDLFGN